MAWKRLILSRLGPGHPRVLDLACGTGILSSKLAGEGKQVAGLDLTFDYITQAGKKMELAFVQGNAEVLPYRDGVFDAIVSSYLAKYIDAELLADECWRVLAQGGIAVFHDFTCPEGTMRRLWDAYFSLLRLAGRLSKSWRPVFENLDTVICKSDWVNKIVDAMERRGFSDIRFSSHTCGTAAIVEGKKP
jgi:demethylmenaquinone methyltransferase/2-methoxy-6-polyprenyl-1,4-benzoquinol methylase